MTTSTAVRGPSQEQGRRAVRPWPLPEGRRRAGAQAGQHGLGFGVAKAGVEFDYADATGGSCQTAVEHAHKGGTAAGHFVNGGLGYALNDLFDETSGQPGQGGVSAHATSVGALVVIENTLEVLGR